MYVLDFGMCRKFTNDQASLLEERRGYCILAGHHPQAARCRRLPRHRPLRAHRVPQEPGAVQEGRRRDVAVHAGFNCVPKNRDTVGVTLGGDHRRPGALEDGHGHERRECSATDTVTSPASSPGRPSEGGRSQRPRPAGALRRLPAGVPPDDQVRERARVRECALSSFYILSRLLRIIDAVSYYDAPPYDQLYQLCR